MSLALVICSPTIQPPLSQPPMKALGPLLVSARRWAHDPGLQYINAFNVHAQKADENRNNHHKSLSSKSQEPTSCFLIFGKEKHRAKRKLHSVPSPVIPRATKFCCSSITARTNLFSYIFKNTPHASLKFRAHSSTQQ